ncbi:oxidoreductase [Deminuibacter soli]|uniref:SDR family NAD(P)-dependent oxidoreductase n=1 Tax=Deminuibacter soli TaxID=2291815 RepID=A0A3E1NCP2_9BACT|nr:oxidoreductase [Deminuibacter soli]RFM25779.1 SDR family NAD(P)-dependent oxidoreductase [Deminuibacter soli]
MWTLENIGNLTGKTFLVTGANAGIGYETALALYQKGGHVIVACRSKEKAEETMRRMMADKQYSGSLEAGVVDLASMTSVRNFAAAVVQQHNRLDVLINNAGVMVPPASVTEEGFELQYGVNFLGHFLLTANLLPLLRKASSARVVTLTSLAYNYGTIDFDNLRLEKPYEAFDAYCNSKLACMLFTTGLQQRFANAGLPILSLAAHPGITATSLARNMSEEAIADAVQRLGAMMPAAQGALPALYAAVAENVQGGGLYGPDQDGGLRGYPAQGVIGANGTDSAVADALWQAAEASTGAHPFAWPF